MLLLILVGTPVACPSLIDYFVGCFPNHCFPNHRPPNHCFPNHCSSNHCSPNHAALSGLWLICSIIVSFPSRRWVISFHHRTVQTHCHTISLTDTIQSFHVTQSFHHRVLSHEPHHVHAHVHLHTTFQFPLCSTHRATPSHHSHHWPSYTLSQ